MDMPVGTVYRRQLLEVLDYRVSGTAVLVLVLQQRAQDAHSLRVLYLVLHNLNVPLRHGTVTNKQICNEAPS